MNAPHVLSNLEAYELWARRYPPLPHNPLMRAEQNAMLQLWPDVTGARCLDLACGSGRYSRLLKERGAAHVVASDLSPAMLQQVQADECVRADMMQLPFADAHFDIVVSGLAVGHAPDLDDWMQGAARVLAPGGVLLYSDFHADAAQAGMTRSFTDEQQRKHTLLHSLFAPADHRRAAAAAGLVVEAELELRAGQELQETFEGSADFYRRWQGLALVFVLRCRKPPRCSPIPAA